MKKLTLSAVAVSLALTAGMAMAKGDEWKEEFTKADTNKDQKLSMSEWDAYGKQMFKEIDTNGDQQVTMEEKQAYKEKKHGVQKDMKDQKEKKNQM